jgi:hypothetical protein
MNKVDFKNRVIALAIGLTMVSCSGSGQKPQSSSGSDGQTAKVETQKSATVAGSMEAFSENDLDELSQNWKNNFPSKTGINNLGKPKGSSIEMAAPGESHFVINFECENPSAVCASYAKAVWDLTKGIAENGELRIYVGGETKYKAGSFEQTKYEDSENYTWYYSYGGSVWEMNVKVFNSKLIKLIVEKK